jgi:hypothetical protein
MKLGSIFILVATLTACAVDTSTQPPPVKPAQPVLVLPLEVDMEAATAFVRLAFNLDGKNFQSTEFLTPRLRTTQAQPLIRMVGPYNEFDGPKVADALGAFRGKVSSVQFGREGSPVLYVELPYWTHQREGSIPGMGTKITDDENDNLVEELRQVFVVRLQAEEFSARARMVRIWWD